MNRLCITGALNGFSQNMYGMENYQHDAVDGSTNLENVSNT